MRTFLVCSVLLFGSSTYPLAQDNEREDVAQAIANRLAERNESIDTELAYRLLEKTYWSLEFVLYHELAHMLINDLELPVLGWEEDAADTLAVAMLVGEETDRNYDVLATAIQNWALTQVKPEQISNEAFYDSHSFNLQRAYHATCLLVGRNPDRYAPIGDAMEMPKRRREECIHSSKRALDNWRFVLDPHLRSEGGAEGGSIQVTYFAPEPGLQEAMAILLRDTQFLEQGAELLRSAFALPRNLEFIATPCGRYGAFFVRDPGHVVMCYEMAVAHFELFALEALANAKPETPPDSDGAARYTLEIGPGDSGFGDMIGTPQGITPGSWSIRLNSDGTWSGHDAHGNPLGGEGKTELNVRGLENLRTCPGRGEWPLCYTD